MNLPTSSMNRPGPRAREDRHDRRHPRGADDQAEQGSDHQRQAAPEHVGDVQLPAADLRVAGGLEEPSGPDHRDDERDDHEQQRALGAFADHRVGPSQVALTDEIDSAPIPPASYPVQMSRRSRGDANTLYAHLEVPRSRRACARPPPLEVSPWPSTPVPARRPSPPSTASGWPGQTARIPCTPVAIPELVTPYFGRGRRGDPHRRPDRGGGGHPRPPAGGGAA